MTTEMREYIGSRYVPIFGRKGEDSIAWDNSKSYEPLTIVTYNGNSYTSRQFVPANISINNEEYWALTGNYNAQVEQYRQEVETFDSRISANEDDIEELQNTVKNEFVVIGDSWSKWSYDAQTSSVVSSGEELWTKVQNKTGYTCHNYAVGGAGFINTTYTESTFAVQLARVIADYTNKVHDINKLRHVIILGGTNDYETQTLQALQDALTAILHTYGWSILHNVPLTVFFNKSGYTANRSIMLNGLVVRGYYGSSYYPSLRDNANFFSLESALCGFNTFGADFVHPNNFGYTALSHIMAAVLNNQPYMTCRNSMRESIENNYGITVNNLNTYINNGTLTVRADVVLPANTEFPVTQIPVIKLPNMAQAFADNPPVSYNYSSAVRQIMFENTLNAAVFFTTKVVDNDGIIQMQILDKDSNPITLTSATTMYINSTFIL